MRCAFLVVLVAALALLPALVRGQVSQTPPPAVSPAVAETDDNPGAETPESPAPVVPAPMLPEPRMITLTFTGPVDLREFLNYVSKATGRHFLYDEKILVGQVILLAPTKIPEDSLYALLESLLEYEGFALVPSTGGLIKVVSTRGPELARRPLPLLLPEDLDSLPDSDTIVTTAYRLKYVGTPEVQSAVAPLLVASQGALIPIARSNILMLTDYLSNLKRIVKIIRIVDDEKNAPKVQVFQLVYANADFLAGQLMRVLRAEAGARAATAEQQQMVVEPDPATNKIIAVATDAAMKRIQELIEQLDVEPAETSRNVQFYELKNTKAEDVGQTLQQLAQQIPSGVRNIPGAGATGRPAAGPGVGLITAGEVKIIADKGSNSIIVMGPASAQADIKAIIEKLDKRRAQVLIKALVVQVSGGSDLDVGVELANWAGESKPGGVGVTAFDFSTYNYTTGVRTIKAAEGGTGYLVNDSQIPILLRALLVEDKGKIISRPMLMANDNSDATFKSLDQQPTSTVSAISSNTSTVSFGTYQEAGTTLTITPHIAPTEPAVQGGEEPTAYLSLDVKLEISQFTGTSTDPVIPPPKRTDNLEAKVTIPDQSTIVVGGLSGYHVTDKVRQVPLLGKLPILGALFRRTTRTVDDTTEYIFIKAQIAKDEQFKDLLGISKEAEDHSKIIENEVEPGSRPKEKKSGGD